MRPLLILTALLELAPPLRAQSLPLWQFTHTRPLSLVRTTATGKLLIGSSDGIQALDMRTGQVVWKRTDLTGPTVVSVLEPAAWVVVQVGKQLEVVDLETGVARWRTPELLTEVLGYSACPDRALLLLYGMDASRQTVLLGAELETGKVRWRHPNPFIKPPSQPDRRSAHWPAVLWVSDTSFVLHVSQDGPVLVHARTGAWLWRADALRGKQPPSLRDFRPRAVLGDSVVFVRLEHGVQALRLRDGAALWSKSPDYRNVIGSIQRVAGGVLVQGAEVAGLQWLDNLDEATGESRWHGLMPSMGVPFLERGNRVLAVTDEKVSFEVHSKLIALPLTGGRTTEWARLPAGAETVRTLEALPDGILIRSIGFSSVIVGIVDSTGAWRYVTTRDRAGSHPSRISPLRQVLGFALGFALEGLLSYGQPRGSGFSLIDYDVPNGQFTHLELAQMGKPRDASPLYLLSERKDSAGDYRPVLLEMSKSDGQTTERAVLDRLKRGTISVAVLDHERGVLVVRHGNTGVQAFGLPAPHTPP